MYTKRFLQATIAARDEETIHGAFASLLSRNSRQAPQHADIAAGLAWSQSEVRANVLHVPLSPLEDVQSAWKLGEAAKAHLKAAVSQVTPARLDAILGTPPVRTAHVYAGSHMEAVPGQCVLPNIVTDALSVVSTTPS